MGGGAQRRTPRVLGLRAVQIEEPGPLRPRAPHTEHTLWSPLRSPRTPVPDPQPYCVRFPEEWGEKHAGAAARDPGSWRPWSAGATRLDRVWLPGPGLCRFNFPALPVCPARHCNQRTILKASMKSRKTGQESQRPRGGSGPRWPGPSPIGSQGCLVPRWVCASAPRGTG